MKKVYLLEKVQHKMKSYTGCIDARELVRLATKTELKAVQDAQRPIDPVRLEDISKFVSADGTLSTSIVIGTKNSDKLSVHKVELPGCNKLYYMEFPETEEEYKDYEDSFDIMDGQHRLFSFLEEYVKISDDVVFEITFEMYITPTMRERRLIFKNTNEKQKSVASNLLMWFREKLNLLTNKEQLYHPVVSLLNSEACSPLKGRIIMGAEANVGGLKAEQMINILYKSDIKNIGSTPLDEHKMLNLISQYLAGWEIAVGSKICDRDRTYGAFSKIAGFRFMILMLPAFYEQAILDRAAFNKEYVSKKILTLFSKEGKLPGDIFNKDSEYIKNLGNNPFAGETPTTILAKEWINKLKSLSSDTFDPLA